MQAILHIQIEIIEGGYKNNSWMLIVISSILKYLLHLDNNLAECKQLRHLNIYSTMTENHKDIK